MGQLRCLPGRPFQNPDGTADDWREQKIFYGVAWADLLVALVAAVEAWAFDAPARGEGKWVKSGREVHVACLRRMS